MKSKLGESCSVCGHKLREFLKVEGFKISKCSDCGLGKTYNTLPQGSAYHRDEVYQKFSRQFINIFQRRVNIVTSFHPNPGKVLEIGSSTGLMLSLFRGKGWQVQGLEISSPAAQSAQKWGIDTLTTPIEKVNLPACSFDVVIINHTLEHLENPPQVLAKIYSLLKDGGLLLVDVPNFGSLGAKIFKSHWFALLPQEHLWHFTFEALSKLLSKNGFHLIQRSSPSGIWDYGSPFREVWQSLNGLKKRFLGNVLLAGPNLLVSLLNQGATLTILARKVKK